MSHVDGLPEIGSGLETSGLRPGLFPSTIRPELVDISANFRALLDFIMLDLDSTVHQRAGL